MEGEVWMRLRFELQKLRCVSLGGRLSTIWSKAYPNVRWETPEGRCCTGRLNILPNVRFRMLSGRVSDTWLKFSPRTKSEIFGGRLSTG